MLIWKKKYWKYIFLCIISGYDPAVSPLVLNRHSGLFISSRQFEKLPEKKKSICGNQKNFIGGRRK